VSEHELDLVGLAGRICDGVEVDWDEAERSVSTGEDRRVVRHLREVQSVAEVHRGESHASTTQPHEMSATLATETLTETDLGAPHWGLDREVALKLLKKGPSVREDLVAAVLKEGRLLARVRHPNVVTVFGAEVHDDQVGVWMDFVRGRSLSELLEEQGRFGAREASLIGLDLCRALAAVHGAGLVHRDIKTRNVMREEGGRILLMDFGAGRDLTEIEGREDRSISGTPLYIAPEVYRRRPATARSDIYSLGVLLYHLVTGSYPVRARSLSALRTAHDRGEVRLLRDARPDLPEAFVGVVECALDPDPDKRFATAGQMEQALAAALGVERGAAAGPTRESGPPRPAVDKRPPFWSIAAMVTLGIVALGVVLWAINRPVEETRAAVRYSVGASLYRIDENNRRERLESGARVRPGNTLSLEVRASRALHVYVVTEDDAGRGFALFPSGSHDLKNPLPPNRTHALPGEMGGITKYWVVDTAGGREHLLVLASPDPLAEFEAELASLPRPGADQLAVALPEKTMTRLRGIGGLARAPQQQPGGTADRLFEMAAQLAGGSETVEGVWMRRIDLENPAP
jgi:serine/threonine-protein kinase